MQKDEQIQNIVRELSDETIKSGANNATVVFTHIDNRVSASVTGKHADLIMLVAKAVAEAPELADVLRDGLSAAPLVGILFGKGESTQTCDCPRCTAERKAKAENPNVN